jgi:peptidoglycan hydrolase-like protein with peptidoglycan-binding domain
VSPVGAPRLRRVLLGLLLAGLLAGGVAAYVWPRDSDAKDPDSDEPSGTATAARRDLVDVERVSGTLEYADTFSVVPSGEGVLTELPDEGSVLRRGDVAYRVDDQPVVLLQGALPLWRSLSEGMEGRDVRELERNLDALGYDPGTVDDYFSGYTEAALLDLQDDIGQDETGVADPADFVVTAGPVRVGAHTASVGDQLVLGVDAELYTASGLEQVVTVDLDPDDESLARIGARATVTLPDGKEIGARIASVGEVEETEGDDGSTVSTIPVTLTVRDAEAVKGMNAATVGVDLTREAEKHALAVPVTALVALAEGGYGVQRLDASGTPELVAVEPGLYADGYVAIVDGLSEGDEVVVPE